jgi:hypothetical protein
LEFHGLGDAEDPELFPHSYFKFDGFDVARSNAGRRERQLSCGPFMRLLEMLNALGEKSLGSFQFCAASSAEAAPSPVDEIGQHAHARAGAFR